MPSLEVISDFHRLEQIDGAWRLLADQLTAISPFQLPDWQLAWWRHFGSGNLSCFAFWDGARLVGLVPAFCHEWCGRRQLTLIGSGLTDYLEPCIGSEEVLPLLSHALAESPNWEVCNWQDLSASTSLRNLTGLSIEVQEEVPCKAIRLEEGFDNYWQGRSADLRRNIKRYSRKAEAEGSMTFRVVEKAEPALIDVLIRLHGLRWQRQGEAGMVEVNRSGNFLREVFALSHCRLFSVEWKGEVVAMTAGFLRERSVYSYLSAFDPQYEILGFGRYLLFRSLQWAVTNGYERWDFLRGDEAYKASWGAEPIGKCRLLITRS